MCGPHTHADITVDSSTGGTQIKANTGVNLENMQTHMKGKTVQADASKDPPQMQTSDTDRHYIKADTGVDPMNLQTHIKGKTRSRHSHVRTSHTWRHSTHLQASPGLCRSKCRTCTHADIRLRYRRAQIKAATGEDPTIMQTQIKGPSS